MTTATRHPLVGDNSLVVSGAHSAVFANRIDTAKDILLAVLFGSGMFVVSIVLIVAAVML